MTAAVVNYLYAMTDTAILGKNDIAKKWFSFKVREFVILHCSFCQLYC